MEVFKCFKVRFKLSSRSGQSHNGDKIDKIAQRARFVGNSRGLIILLVTGSCGWGRGRISSSGDGRVAAGVGWARAVGVALSRALGLLAAVVPAAAVRDLFGGFAGQALRVEHLTVGAAELVGLLAVEAGEEELAVGRVGIDGVLLEESVGSDLAGSGAGEAFDGLELSGIGTVAPLGLVGPLLLADAAADGRVEDERVGAGHLEGGAVVASVELVADGRVFVIKDAVGSLAPGVDSGLGLLLELSLAAVDVVREDALLAVPDGVVKEEAVWAENSLTYVVLAEVVEVTLFRVREEAVLLGTSEGEGRSGEVLSDDGGRHDGDDESGSDHVDVSS